MIGSFKLPILNGGEVVVNEYIRPSDWLVLPTVLDTDHKAVLLHAIFDHDSNFCALQCASNYTVDWGDGTVTNHNANVSAYHIYDYNYAGFVGTESTRGYRQAIVTITPQATFDFTKLNLQIKHNQASLGAYAMGWLDISLSGSLLSSLSIGGLTVMPRYLEIFEFLGGNLLTFVSGLFQNANNLQKVSLFPTENSTTFKDMFNGCYLLQSVPLFDTSSATIMTSMFTNCASLKEAPNVNMANVINCTNMFQGCSDIKTAPAFNTTLLLNSCHTMFSGCSYLNSVALFETASVTTMANMFDGCVSLLEVPLFDTQNVTSMNTMFRNCVSLKTVPLFNTIKVADFVQMFLSCSSLQIIPTFVLGVNAAIGLMAYSCFSLNVFPALDGTKITAFNSTLQNSSSISRFLVKNIAQSISFAEGGAKKMSAPALVEVFNNLDTVAGKTITITGNWGAALLTAPERAIATDKGWTIVG